VPAGVCVQDRARGGLTHLSHHPWVPERRGALGAQNERGRKCLPFRDLRFEVRPARSAEEGQRLAGPMHRNLFRLCRLRHSSTKKGHLRVAHLAGLVTARLRKCARLRKSGDSVGRASRLVRPKGWSGGWKAGRATTAGCNVPQVGQSSVGACKDDRAEHATHCRWGPRVSRPPCQTRVGPAIGPSNCGDGREPAGG